MSGFSVLRLFLISLACVLPVAGDAIGCQSGASPPGAVSDETPESATTPILTGITADRRPMSTDVAPAQRYFDQGLSFTEAFNSALMK